MKIRGLLIATVILAALGGVLYWSDHRKPGVEAAKPSDAAPVILKLEENSITRLALKKKDSPAVLLEKDGPDWKITEPKPLAADQSTASSVVSRVASLSAERLVDEKGADLRRYGLDPPSLELDVTEKDNKAQRLLLGDDTPAGSATYAALVGDPRIFTIAGYNKGTLDKSLNDLRDKRLLPVDAARIGSVEIAGKNLNIEFGQTKDGWQILKPSPMRTDVNAVGALVAKLTAVRMDLGGSGTAKESESAFAHGAPIATVKLTSQSSTQQLQLRQNKDSYYAKSSMVDGVYKVASDLGDAVSQKIDNFRNKALFDFGYADPNKLEVHSGAKVYSLVRSGQDWWDDGKKMDESGVASMISGLRNLSADKFVDSGFTTPEVEATVTSEDGKRVETVLISKAGSVYIAKREKEPALYQLSGASIDDLQKSLAGIKPSPVASKTGK